MRFRLCQHIMSLGHEKLTSYDGRTRILVVDKHALDSLVAVWVTCSLRDIEIILPTIVSDANAAKQAGEIRKGIDVDLFRTNYI